MSKTKVPAIPAPTDANLRDVARALKGVIDVREGLLGDPLDKAVTFRDLVDGGIVEPVIVSRGGGSGAISVGPAPGLGSGGSGSLPEPDLTPPPAPTGLAASAGIAVIILEWDAANYSNHAFTEIWRSEDNVLGNAVRVATTEASLYADNLGVTGAQRYYWVRHRSTADVAGPYNATNGVVATTGKIGNVDLGPLIVEAGNLASGAVTATKLAAEAVSLTNFAAGIEPVTVVQGSTVPTTKSTNTIFLAGEGKLYRWNGTAYTAAVPAADLSGTIVEAQIADGSVVASKIADATLTAAKFASGIEPLTIVTGALPTTKSTNTIFRTDDSKTYRWNGTAYVASVPAADIAGQVTDAQVEGLAASKVTGQLTNSQIADVAAAKITGEVVSAQIANAAISTAKFASGIEPVGVVSALPAVSGYTGPKTVMLTTDSKLYRFTGTAWTAVVEAVDIDSRGLDIKDITGNIIFASDGEIAPTAYVDVNSNNVLISTIAANSLVPSLNYVGAFSTDPTSTTLGAAWKQNAVYKNTLNGKSYVLTGTPLAWVEYLADGQLFLLTIESTNGTIFRVGQNTSTLLKARLFKNGAEVTDVTPEGWFSWRRVSALPQAPPNDDATWNGLYQTGYKQISINVDAVYARATFFCDIVSP